MNILITSGSTSHFIDDVNYLTNISDGSLGSYIGEAFSKQNDVEKIFYVCGKDSRYPWQSDTANDSKFFFDDWLDKVAVFTVDDVHEVTDTVDSILKEYEINTFVHLMNINNYGDSQLRHISNQLDASDMINEIAKEFDLEVDVKTVLPLDVFKTLDNDRITSGHKKLFIEQSPTPKVLKRFKAFKDSILITSKIESNVEDDDIIDIAHHSLKRNGSDMVISMNVNEIDILKEDISYLVDAEKKSDKCFDFDAASNKIVEFVMDKYKK